MDVWNLSTEIDKHTQIHCGKPQEVDCFTAPLCLNVSESKKEKNTRHSKQENLWCFFSFPLRLIILKHSQKGSRVSDESAFCHVFVKEHSWAKIKNKAEEEAKTILKKPTCWSESENRDITLPLCFKTTTKTNPLPRLLLPSNCSSTHTGGFTHTRILFLCLISLKSGGHDRTLADKLNSLVPPSFTVPTCVLPVTHRTSKCCSATRCTKLGPQWLNTWAIDLYSLLYSLLWCL